ncbi:hypothetical protein [Shinella sp.]|uniref:hypothetical protein n=1 Tax=Shinella sp. TaxID=1870904 RepID=UPI003D297A6E
MLTVDELAQEIRRVDGNHSLGAGALAEALLPFFTDALEVGQPVAVEPEPVAWMYQFKTNAPVLMVEKRNWAETHSEWTETPLYAHPPLSALVNAQADADVVERWQPIDTAPKDGVRVILMWEPFGGVSEHVELGKWSIRNGWVNTYGHAFTGSPTHWMPLPPPSTTRIADSAEAGGSATSTIGTGGDHG